MNGSSSRNAIRFSGAGRLNIGGSISGGDLVRATDCIVNYNGTSAQTVAINSDYQYHHLYLNNTATATLQAAITATNVSGDVKVQSGTFSNGGFAITMAASREFEVSNGATFTMTGTTSVPTGTGLTKTFRQTSITNYAGAAQSVSGETYGHLNLSTASGSSTKTAAAGITVKGDMTVGANTTFAAGSYSHTLEGDWTNTGTLSAGTSTFIMGGTAEQAMSGSTFYNLTIDNAAGVVMNTDETVSNLLTLTTGHIIVTDPSVLSITSPTGISYGAAGSYWIRGKLSRAFNTTTALSYLFPLGTASNYRNATLTFAATGSTGTILASYVPGDPGNAGLPINDGTGGPSPILMNNSGKEGVWKFTTGAITSPQAFDLTLSVENYPNLSALSGVRIIKRDAGGNWTMEGIYAAPGTNTVSRTGMYAFDATSDDNEYDIVGGYDNPLPVELTSFSARYMNGIVQLRWITATEANNLGFDIERSPNGTEWASAGFVPGAGSSNRPLEYSFTDEPPVDVRALAGAWYRLVQRDRTGERTPSKSLRVLFSASASDGGITVYPLPVRGGEGLLTLSYSLAAAGPLTIRVFDAMGREVTTHDIGHQLPGHHQAQIGLPHLAAGMYHIQAWQSGVVQHSTRIITTE